MPELNKKIPWYPIIWVLTTLVFGAIGFTTVKLTGNYSERRITALETTVGTSSGKKGNLCERTNTLETTYDFILKELKSINGKLP